MVDDDHDGPDLETLQAQIDMSLAFTHNVVSGWMKSSKAKLPSSTSRNEDKELEEYMRRPARLGVGASAPEATGVLSRETAKLRSKLTGSGKKRDREDDDAPARPGAKKAGGGAPESDGDDDDEDSRARVITKKARIDPFAAKGDGKKKKKGDHMAVPAAPAKAVSPSAPPATRDEKGTEIEGPAGEATRCEISPENDAAPPTSKKKKKKHKANAGEVALNGAQPEGHVSPNTTVGSLVPGSKQIAGSTVPAVSPKPKPTPATNASFGATPGAEPTPSSQQSVQLAAHAATSPPKPSPTTRQGPLGLPLLNLAGPPPASEELQRESPKKKRKRKKKKKKAVAQPASGVDAVREDGDDDGSDDD